MLWSPSPARLSGLCFWAVNRNVCTVAHRQSIFDSQARGSQRHPNDKNRVFLENSGAARQAAQIKAMQVIESVHT